MKECPNCREELRPFRFAALPLDGCVTCGGIWFDGDELKRAKQAGPQAWMRLDRHVGPRAPATVALTPERAARDCPLCHAPMRPYEFLGTSGIWLDECDRCGGHWADDGELARMSAYLERRRDDEAIPAELLAASAGLEAQMALRRDRARGIAAFWSALMSPGF